ncbi:SET domain-containing protein [Ferruginibacter albus]|uniref:SET domain-containing protein n=1 Tax=Ferruginibacter albus TaxID=2875540 RepID=UPI001CC72973|nr:SET domain-containing protein [Ferruginibacter albus]UAY52278.1 SET domain-containing protein [Ferruginibacter albus]
MDAKQLLAELRNETYVMIKPSPIDGIGVFAIRDIPKGCRSMFSKNMGEWIPIPKIEIDSLPRHSKQLVETYCLFDDDQYFVPDYGFKVMDLVNYLNHSETPNIISINDGEVFEAIRDIKEGEELLINYGDIVESDE